MLGIKIILETNLFYFIFFSNQIFFYLFYIYFFYHEILTKLTQH